MSARRHFWSAAACRRFTVDKAPRYEWLEGNGWRRKSGSKLPHSKAGLRQHDRMTNHGSRVTPPSCGGRAAGPTTAREPKSTDKSVCATMKLEDDWRCAKLWIADAKSATAETWNFGLRATRSREPRQARKGATVPGKPSVPRRSRSSSSWNNRYQISAIRYQKSSDQSSGCGWLPELRSCVPPTDLQ